MGDKVDIVPCRKIFASTAFIIIIIMISIQICAISQVHAMAMHESDFASHTATLPSIVWETSVVESGITTSDGFVRFPQSGLELTWTVDASGHAQLHTMDPSGSGELPPHAVRIHPVLFDDGTALLAKEFFPLFNSKQPVSVKILGAVEASNLLAPWDLSEIPQGSTNHHVLSRITFGEQYEIKGMKVQQGVMVRAGGNRSLIWQKTPEGSYKLASVDQGRELHLIPLLDNTNSTAYIFAHETSQVQGVRLGYLRYVGKTALDELLEGFRRL